MDTIEANKFEEYVKNLLECPVCMEPIQSAQIHQCTNGHVLCKDCIAKLESCPICRNDSNTARNLIFEQIIGNFIANQEPYEKPELQKWEKVCVGAPFSKNRPNEEPSVQLNIQPNSETIASVELGESDNRIMSTTSKSNKFERYVKGLLEYPNCNEPIKTTESDVQIPYKTVTNSTIAPSNSERTRCNICKYDFGNKEYLMRHLRSKIHLDRANHVISGLESSNAAVQYIRTNIFAIELENKKPLENPEHKEWGASLSSNGLNEEPSVQLDIQPNLSTMESVELGGTDNRSTLKCDDMISAFWNCFKNLCVPVLYLIGLISFCIFLFLVFFNYFMYCVVGVDIGIFTPRESCKVKVSYYHIP